MSSWPIGLCPLKALVSLDHFMSEVSFITTLKMTFLQAPSSDTAAQSPYRAITSDLKIYESFMSDFMYAVLLWLINRYRSDFMFIYTVLHYKRTIDLHSFNPFPFSEHCLRNTA